MENKHASGDASRRDRRAEPRWRDRRLVLLRTQGGELPGVTEDISMRGMRVELAADAAAVGTEVTATVAFAQELIEVHGEVTHVWGGAGGTVAGIRLGPGEVPFSRFVWRRYSSH